MCALSKDVVVLFGGKDENHEPSAAVFLLDLQRKVRNIPAFNLEKKNLLFLFLFRMLFVRLFLEFLLLRDLYTQWFCSTTVFL